MVGKMIGLVSIGAVLTCVAPVAAQRIEVGTTFNGGLSDGVSGESHLAVDGHVYDRVDPSNGFAWGLSAGVLITPQIEAEFIWSRQGGHLQLGGTNSFTVGDMDIYTYHGAFVYNFLSEDAPFRPYVLGGLGATNYGAVSFTDNLGVQRNIDGHTKFSTTWGAGVKVYAHHNVGFRAGIRLTPSYIKTDSAGWWCDPYWGCYVVGNAQYATQLEIGGGITVRF
jgi:opacity protein-like surface antigen